MRDLTGTVKAGCEVQKIEGAIADYETVLTTEKAYRIAYHFYQKFCKDYYYQIGPDFPKTLKGSELGNFAENALDGIVATLEDAVKG